jgi:GT2 family glycosyltransferase
MPTASTEAGPATTAERVAPEVTVCMFAGRRGPVLAKCLASLRQQESPPPFELLVTVDRDPKIAEQVHAVFPGAVLGTVDTRLPGAARNPLIERARGELLLFLDDDVVAGPDLLRRAVEIADAHPEAGVFGGPNLTPPGSSNFQFVQGAVLGTVVASGPVRRRYAVHPAGPTDEASLTLCNLLVRRSVAVPFSSDLVCAEENEAMRRMRHEGVRMRFEPDLGVYHERRGSIRSFAAQMRKYGVGRGQLLARDPGALRLWHLVPTLLLAYLCAVPLLLATAGMALIVPVAPLVVYLLAVVAGATVIGFNTGGFRPLTRLGRRVVLAAFLVFVVHAAYGYGVPRGLVTRRAAPAPPPVWVAVDPLGGGTSG